MLNLCVARGFRCRGVGKQLLLRLLERAARRRHGARRSSKCARPTPPRSACTSRSASSRSGMRRGYYQAASGREDAAVLQARRCARPAAAARLEPPASHDRPDLPRSRRRRTFAIISHPDAGKTTLTEKLLLFGGAIQMAGTVKGRKAARHATSDWMRLEQQRGISVTSSVMQFPYRDCIVNLLDTPGPRGLLRGHLPHADRGGLGADGHRLRQGRRGAHDQADGGVPAARHADHDLHQQARPRRARADRAAGRDRERAAASHPRRSPGRSAWGASCAASTTCSRTASTSTRPASAAASARTAPSRACTATPAREFLGERRARLRRGDRAGARRHARASTPAAYLRRPADAGVLRLGHQQFRRRGAAARLRRSTRPAPLPRATRERERRAARSRRSTGFVFKIQANMDPAHRDRIAFLRLCSGKYQPRHAPVPRAPAARRCASPMR